MQLQRKKSLPDVQELPRQLGGLMSREEVSVLGSARREEVRRQIETSERLKANPLLYLVSPQVKVQSPEKENPRNNKSVNPIKCFFICACVILFVSY